MIRFSLNYKSDDRRHGLCTRIISDLEQLNEYYEIYPPHLTGGLEEDVNFLIQNDIAAELKLVFYSPINPKDIYFEKSYKVNSSKNNSMDDESIRKLDIPSPYEFDIFVYFSPKFLSLSESAQHKMIENFNFKWFDFSSLFNESSLPDKDDANDGDDVIDDEVNFNNKIEEPGSKKTDKSFLPRKIPFSEGQSLYIASYSNSRKLIEEFVGISRDLGLKAVQWTYSEGFKSIGDSFSERYLHDDESFTRLKLSPFDALRIIKNEARSNTIYLLEDFHYYLSRENVPGAEFAELISLIKSMPESLLRKNSFVVILAPTLDLPPEISPIFEIIKEDAGDKAFHYLKLYGTDLTKLVLEKKIKPIIGRDKEILECLKILSRMEGNNPILLGNSGVGKTAIVEGLAISIIKNEVPERFANKRIISLNLNAMVSGTKYRGEFEKRLEGLLDEVKSNSQRVIIFIDEIHAMLGMGASEGATGAENILKPSLARGEFPCIGATTFEEYKRYIEPDKALSRRFQVVNVSEPNAEQTIVILKGVKNVFEDHHQVKIPDETIVKCVELSGSMLKNQYFPGKALKMLDSVCSSAFLAGEKAVTPDLVINEFSRL